MRLIFILCLIIFPCIVYCQSTGNIKGRLADQNHQPIPFATVAIYKLADSSLIDFRLSNDNGDFKIPAIPIGIKFKIIITCVGRRSFKEILELTKNILMVDMGEVLMDEQRNELKEMKIVAEVPPVVVRQDTIEFNAGSFRTLPTAVVEDLLKKLPGIQVDKQGNIKYKGKTVQKILVDSKTFFGGNITIATRNLPADIIDKVQVLNDKDEAGKDPFVSKNNVPVIINLQLKKAIKRGLFGKVYGGAATSGRYEAGGIINTFRDTVQLSILGYTNNLNKAGFEINELEENGGFNRSEISNVLKTPLNPGGLDFGGSESGIQVSTGTGANFNTAIGKKTELNVRYFFGKTNSQLYTFTNTRQQLNDTVLNTLNEASGNNLNRIHSFGGKLKGTIGENFYYTFEPTVTIKMTGIETSFLSSAFNNFLPQLNQSVNVQHVQNNSAVYSSNFSSAYIFKKPGRRFSLSHELNIGQNTGDFYGNVQTRFFYPDSLSLLSQLRAMNNRGVANRIVMKFYEPINKQLLLGVTANINHFTEYDNLLTFYPNVDQQYIIQQDNLSNTLERKGWKNSLAVGLKKTINHLEINPALRLYAINISNIYLTWLQVPQKFLYLLPELSLDWRKIHFEYKMSAREPDGQYLQPVINNINPLYQINNNISLVPEIIHRGYLNYNSYDEKAELNKAIALSGGYYENSIIQSRNVDVRGVQVITPVNVSGNWDLSSGLSISKDYGSGSRKLSLALSAMAQLQRNAVLVNHQKGTANILNLKPEFMARLNLSEKFESTGSYAYTYYTANYTLPGLGNFKLNTHTANADITYYALPGLGIHQEFQFSYNPDASSGIQQSALRWNAEITYSFLNKNRIVMRLTANDVLNQGINTYRTIAANFIEEKQINALRRYFLCTLTYNVRDFKQRKPVENPLIRF